VRVEIILQSEKKAEDISPNNSEIYCLKALSATIRINVNPTVRGFQYVLKSNNHLKEAEFLDNSNPRVYYLKGINTLNSPAIMGGGAKSAKPHFVKAVELYEMQDAIGDKKLPDWGYVSSKTMLERIMAEE